MTVCISTDKKLLDVALIHQFLTQHSAWARGIDRATVEKSIAHSLCFGAYIEEQQVGFARVISDYATFANLVDVFVLDAFRGRGVSRQLMSAVVEHPELCSLRRFTLATSDAHGLYAKFGFQSLVKPATFMERYFPDCYQNESEQQ
ncbi:GNAT family N-acetyltransferase [Pleionea sp. CnH1-48]|uniref:GNAT family N-acetyltransferase n=1 Tax=Pleionea sp. CnH1-48 TaxID=2954494 RepID=UPI002098323A|nr:GNAT family N-acetyltransferase [Pleionea sp. CnH1-48]MCO7226772.1 GNAT family N-acetyltransferase [Pleionea sp. CnH1-48]